MRQRTRWMKGFMQVCITHSRRPLWTFLTLGPSRFVGAATLMLGTVITALSYPAFAAFAVASILDGSLLDGEPFRS
jgi:cellulose synthase/poly-beta-1,6-N-acetylglucosamine synthase-like glycosyltransferase